MAATPARALSTSASETISASSSVVTFPDGGVVLGQVRRSARQVATAKALHRAQCRVFDNHIGNNRRSGRKRLQKMIKGPHILHWYLPKVRDPLLIDVDGQNRLQQLAVARERGDIAPKKGSKQAAAAASGKKKR